MKGVMKAQTKNRKSITGVCVQIFSFYQKDLTYLDEFLSGWSGPSNTRFPSKYVKYYRKKANELQNYKVPKLQGVLTSFSENLKFARN